MKRGVPTWAGTAIWVLASAAPSALGIGCGTETFEIVVIDDERDLRSIDVGDDGNGWIVGRGGAVHRYTDGAVRTGSYTPETVRPPDFFSVALHRGVGFAAGDAGAVIVLGDDELVPEDSGHDLRWRALVEVTPSSLLAAGEGPAVRERGADAQWRSIDAEAPSTVQITGAWSAGETIVLTTDRGVLLERDADGDWTAQTLITETTTTAGLPLFDVWSSTVGADLYAVGLGGSVFRRRAGEAQWEDMASPAIDDLYAIDGRSDDEAYAVGSSGAIIRFDGRGWSRLSSGTGRDLFDVRVTAREVIAVGEGGTIVRRPR